MYLEGSHAELDEEPQVHVEVVGQKIEEHVVSAEQRDEEEGGLSQASVAQKERNNRREVKRPRGVVQCVSYLNAVRNIMHEDALFAGCQSRQPVPALVYEQKGSGRCLVQ